MRNILTAALVAGFCAVTFAAPPAGAEPVRKIDNFAKLNWLELRTKFAASDGSVGPEIKANQRSTAHIGDVNRDTVPSALNILGSDLHSAWDLVQQQAQLAAKFTSKRLDHRPEGPTAPELAWGWQHEL
jgi:hypothetical protein